MCEGEGQGSGERKENHFRKREMQRGTKIPEQFRQELLASSVERSARPCEPGARSALDVRRFIRRWCKFRRAFVV